MFVVVMGDLKRNSESDRQQVLELLEELKTTYSDLTIVSGACKEGIGRFVRDRCISDTKKLEFSFVEIDVRIWSTLPPAVLSKVYMSRNPALEYIGEVFEIFPYGGDVGHIPDLIRRIQKLEAPLRVHHRNGKVETFNYCLTKSDSHKTGETLKSHDLKSQLE